MLACCRASLHNGVVATILCRAMTKNHKGGGQAKLPNPAIKLVQFTCLVQQTAHGGAGASREVRCHKVAIHPGDSESLDMGKAVGHLYLTQFCQRGARGPDWAVGRWSRKGPVG